MLLIFLLLYFCASKTKSTKSYFDYIFVHLRQKVRLRPELSPKFLSILGPNPARSRPEKPGPTCNSASVCDLSDHGQIYFHYIKKICKDKTPEICIGKTKKSTKVDLDNKCSKFRGYSQTRDQTVHDKYDKLHMVLKFELCIK